LLLESAPGVLNFPGAVLRGQVPEIGMQTQELQYREIITAAGDAFSVPEYIVRMDDATLKGWQLRYGEWTDYQDRAVGKSGAEKALAIAIEEMISRIEYKGK